MSASRHEIPPLHRSVVVPWTPARSFERFTAEITRWWPLKTHSVGGDDAVHVEIEPGVEGRIVERDRNGTEHEWGRILAWEPPGLVRFTWHPGQDPSTSTEVELRFTAEGTGTRVVLLHSKWERLGDLAKKARRGYPLGWAYVLSLYADRRGALVMTLDLVGRMVMALGRLRKAS
jgi:uncharacterized protein YndB with AHSA1/START domain